MKLCRYFLHNHKEEPSPSFFYLFKSLHFSKAGSILTCCENEPFLTPWYPGVSLFSAFLMTHITFTMPLPSSALHLALLFELYSGCKSTR